MDTLFFKNVTAVCFSLIVGLTALNADKNETQIFMDKYGQTKIEPIKIEDFKFTGKDNLDAKLIKEINTTKYQGFIDEIDHTEEDPAAAALVEELQSQSMIEKIEEAKDHILYDLDLNVSEYGIEPNQNVTTYDDVLRSKKAFLCISSSMPKELIQSYMQQIEDEYHEVELVLNGFVGGMSKMQPTIDFINSVIMKSEDEAYKVKVQINPKIFMNYQVNRVPALVVDENFNNVLVSQEPYQEAKSNKFVVVYGAASLDALQERAEEKLKEMAY